MSKIILGNIIIRDNGRVELERFKIENAVITDAGSADYKNYEQFLGIMKMNYKSDNISEETWLRACAANPSIERIKTV
jgi:hypothetical protein